MRHPAGLSRSTQHGNSFENEGSSRAPVAAVGNADGRGTIKVKQKWQSSTVLALGRGTCRIRGSRGQIGVNYWRPLLLRRKMRVADWLERHAHRIGEVGARAQR